LKLLGKSLVYLALINKREFNNENYREVWGHTWTNYWKWLS